MNNPQKYKLMSESYKKEIVQHITRNLLDIQLLRIVQAQPTWGYQIKKQVETDFNIKLRHGALYPTLNSLEEKGLLKSTIQEKGKRVRKVYAITENGKIYLQEYYSILRLQLFIAEKTS
jgi:PadR family transcriptional regulator, regulatory protein PadR